MPAFPLLTAVSLSCLHLQADTTARVGGTAISSFNGRPLVGVLIAAPVVNKFVVTDSTGAFTIGGLPGGDQAIRVSYDGRVTEDYTFTLQAGHTKQIAVLLDVAAEDLNPLVVETRGANIWRDLGGFYARRRQYGAFAHFYTREDIGRAKARKLSGLLTLEGIATRCPRSADCIPTRLSRGRLCAVPVSVDGVALGEFNFDRIDVADVAGVEVYRGTPPTDLSTALVTTTGASIWMGSQSSASCGLVMIWTR
ncbi:MAG TPA: carboxypeptidase regulatory-like domain-containing protein [Gemmatimonadales bacterium]|jgi:hypothetical protein